MSSGKTYYGQPLIDDQVEHCLGELVGQYKHTHSFEDEPEKKARQLERNKSQFKKSQKLLHDMLVNEGEMGIKWAIAELLKMNIENPKAPINVDEVKRRAIESIRRRYEG